MRPYISLYRKAKNVSVSGIAVAPLAQKRFRSDQANCDDISTRLREVMRNVAQPVAIVTARNTSSSSQSRYHGATLTSFTSLTLHPHPLVAFSLRLPSRLADCLRPVSSSSPSNGIAGRIPLTVSLLSRTNEGVADALSSRTPDQSAIFDMQGWDTSNPPALKGSIGTLRCEVVSSIPLRDMCDPVEERQSSRMSTGSSELGGSDQSKSAPVPEPTKHQLAGSELFVCKVVDVLAGTGEEPLLHLKQRYVGVKEETATLTRNTNTSLEDKG